MKPTATQCPGPWQDAVADMFLSGVSIDTVAGFFNCTPRAVAEAVLQVSQANLREHAADGP